MTDEAQGLAQWCREQGRSKAWAPETLDIFNAIASLLEREAPKDVAQIAKLVEVATEKIHNSANGCLPKQGLCNECATFVAEEIVAALGGRQP